MSKQMDPLAFMKGKNFVKETINGQEVRFYPVAVDAIYKLSCLDGKVLANIGLLFGSRKDVDAAYQTRKRKIGEEVVDDFGQEAVSLEMAKFRSEERKQAIEEIITGVKAPENIEAVAELLMSSMRDVFGPGCPAHGTTAKDFLATVELPVLFPMVKGLIKSNAEILSPFLGVLLDKIMKSISQKVEENAPPLGSEILESIKKNVPNTKE